MYDAQLGRWHVVDPLAETYYSQSPYHFSGNSPINLIDGNGMNYDWWVTDKDGSLTHTWGDKEPTNTTGMTKIGEDGMFGQEGREYEYQTYSPDNFEEQNEIVLGDETSLELAESAGFTQVEITETSTVSQTQFMPDADFTTQQTTTYTISENESKSITYMPDKVANNKIGTSKTKYGKSKRITPWWSPSMITQDPKVTKSYNKPGTVTKSGDPNKINSASHLIKQIFQGIMSNYK